MIHYSRWGCRPVISSVGSYYTYGVAHPYPVCLSLGEYLVIKSTFVSGGRLWTSSVSSLDAPLIN